jgi:hypothetical protein
MRTVRSSGLRHECGLARSIKRLMGIGRFFGMAELTPLSKPFKSKELAEKERLKYSEKDRKRIGLGVVRTPK